MYLFDISACCVQGVKKFVLALKEGELDIE